MEALKKLVLCVSLQLATEVPPALASHPFLDVDLALGQFEVGAQVRAVAIRDVGPGTHDGAVQYWLWYPATSATKPMRLADYLDPDHEIFDALARRLGVSAEPLKESTMAASLDAPQCNKCPSRLIVVPGGIAGAFQFAPWAEYLASHGYTVAYVEGRGDQVDREQTIDRALADARLVLDELLSDALMAVPASVVALGVHSGGAPATLLQMTRQAVHAVISVEGSESWIFEDIGLPAMQRHAAYSPDRASVPYLFIASNRPDPEWYMSGPARRDLSFYESEDAPQTFWHILPDANHDQLFDSIFWTSEENDRSVNPVQESTLSTIHAFLDYAVHDGSALALPVTPHAD